VDGCDGAKRRQSKAPAVSRWPVTGAAATARVLCCVAMPDVMIDDSRSKNAVVADNGHKNARSSQRR